jgi:uncharacterized protein (TIGR03382 family)
MSVRPLVSVVALALCAGAVSAEVVTVRSGQVGGLPGTVGQSDDIVRYLPTNPGGAPVSGAPFTPADFAGATGGPAAVVINPVFAWTPGIGDASARWINWQADGQIQPDGTFAGTGFGVAGSSLYSVPFFITTPLATAAQITIEYAVDDSGGDILFGGPNPDFLYVNGGTTGYSGGNYATPTVHTQLIAITSGQNYLHLYQRDAGFGVSGLIFSATIEVVPAPGAAALFGLGALVAGRRRR